jgi:hypothetical protein
MTMRARRPTDEWDQDATEVHARAGRAVEQATPTHIDAAPGSAPAPTEQATPTELTARPERSEPIRVISMKDRAAAAPARPAEPRVPLHVQLRSMADVAGVRGAPGGLGRLAPPRDPQQARKRRQRDNVVWACVAIVLACAISLGIWLIAGR